MINRLQNLFIYLKNNEMYMVKSLSIYDKYAYTRQKKLLSSFIGVVAAGFFVSLLLQYYILDYSTYFFLVLTAIILGILLIVINSLGGYFLSLWLVIFSYNILVFIHFFQSKNPHDLYVLIIPFLIICMHFTLQYILMYLFIINIITHGVLFNNFLYTNDIILFSSWFTGVSVLLGMIFIYLNQLTILRHKRLQETLQASIFGLANEAELRDTDTGLHLERTQRYVFLLTSELSRNEKYMPYLTPRYCHDIALASVLHDIGKVGISDTILLKPGKLNKQEFDEIKKHPVLGARLIDQLISRLSFETFFSIARQLALYHHEKWDGTGYPEGLSGNTIPLSARIMSLCDVYDALRSNRPYKSAMSHNESVDIIKDMRETHFDPEIVDVFLSIHLEFLHISSGE